MDTESSSLATSLDEEALSLRKQLSELLSEKESTQKVHQTELLELREEFQKVTEHLRALQQVGLFVVFGEKFTFYTTIYWNSLKLSTTVFLKYPFQEKDVFQKNTEDELNASREQLSMAIAERDRLKKAVEGGGNLIYKIKILYPRLITTTLAAASSANVICGFIVSAKLTLLLFWNRFVRFYSRER